jgi:phosphorylcholine metabolism protein LicD
VQCLFLFCQLTFLPLDPALDTEMMRPHYERFLVADTSGQSVFLFLKQDASGNAINDGVRKFPGVTAAATQIKSVLLSFSILIYCGPFLCRFG